MEAQAPIALRERAWAKPNLDFILGRDREPVPDFPLAVLGPFWTDFILDAAGTNLPRDYFAGCLLGTVASLIGNSRTANLPSPSTQEAPATLWIINVGDPGAGKTPAFLPFIRAVSAIEGRVGETLRIEDATAAGTIAALIRNPHGIGVMNDELSGWWDTFKCDRQGEQFWLKAYNGTMPYTVRRAKGAVEIPRHNLTVVGGTQPATLPTMLEATSGIERGFVSRCMFVFPDKPKAQEATGKTPDTKRAETILERIYGLQPLTDWMPRPIPVATDAAKYHAQWWEDFGGGWIDPQSPDGQWIAKQQGTALRLALVLEVLWWASASQADAATMKKAQAMAAMTDPKRNPNAPQRKVARERLEAFCAKHGLDPDNLDATPAKDGPKSVTLRAMQTACSLIADYFMPHFERCQADAYQPANVKAAIALCRILVKRNVETFNARGLRQFELGKVHPALHGNRATETVNEVCEYLVERNVLRRVESTGVGRKPQSYEVNSLLATMAKRALSK
jgi:hypothetical protein